MNSISHHTPDAMLAAYAAGNLPHPFAVVIATHVSMCAECRAALEAHQAAGGVVLDETEGAALSDRLRDRVLEHLDDVVEEAPVHGRKGIYPGPVVQSMGGRDPHWKPLGMGVRQDILSADGEGSLRLLYIPAGQAVPDHGHRGSELTLVLNGSFSDATGRFGVGDVEVADEDLEHTPVADEGEPCICLAATDAPLRFRGLIPRILQPVFRI